MVYLPLIWLGISSAIPFSPFWYFQENHMNQVTILTSPTCSYCHAAKDLLKQQGISYQEVDATSNSPEVQQLLSKSGQRTVPQIYIDKEPIGGFSELSKLLQSSEFDISNLQHSI